MGAGIFGKPIKGDQFPDSVRTTSRSREGRLTARRNSGSTIHLISLLTAVFRVLPICFKMKTILIFVLLCVGLALSTPTPADLAKREASPGPIPEPGKLPDKPDLDAAGFLWGGLYGLGYGYGYGYPYYGAYRYGYGYPYYGGYYYG